MSLEWNSRVAHLIHVDSRIACSHKCIAVKDSLLLVTVLHLGNVLTNSISLFLFETARSTVISLLMINMSGKNLLIADVRTPNILRFQYICTGWKVWSTTGRRTWSAFQLHRCCFSRPRLLTELGCGKRSGLSTDRIVANIWKNEVFSGHEMRTQLGLSVVTFDGWCVARPRRRERKSKSVFQCCMYSWSE